MGVPEWRQSGRRVDWWRKGPLILHYFRDSQHFGLWFGDATPHCWIANFNGPWEGDMTPVFEWANSVSAPYMRRWAIDRI